VCPVSDVRGMIFEMVQTKKANALATLPKPDNGKFFPTASLRKKVVCSVGVPGKLKCDEVSHPSVFLCSSSTPGGYRPSEY
jgi:hypothetical protein